MATSSLQMGARAAIVGAVAILIAVTFSRPVLAQCSSPETGRWINTAQGGDPEQIEIYFAQCGDTAGSVTRMGVKVFVRQSSGGLYQRPPVHLSTVTDKNIDWLFAKVPTGGYVDKMWMRRIRRNNQVFLKVFIRHESLDSKPSATSWHEYRKS
jgi:hypothetical protein